MYSEPMLTCPIWRGILGLGLYKYRRGLGKFVEWYKEYYKNRDTGGM